MQYRFGLSADAGGKVVTVGATTAMLDIGCTVGDLQPDRYQCRGCSMAPRRQSTHHGANALVPEVKEISRWPPGGGFAVRKVVAT